MEHITTTHTTAQRNRRNPEAPPLARFHVTCSCGADSRDYLGTTFSAAGMAASWIAQHDPRLAAIGGALTPDAHLGASLRASMERNAAGMTS